MEKHTHVLITLPFDEKLVDGLRKISADIKISQHATRQASEIPADVWERTEVLYTLNTLPQPEQAPKLRWVQFHWAGIDDISDAPILKKEGLIATTLSGANASQVAEFALTMLLALGHHLPGLLAQQGRNQWPSGRAERFTPQELRGSTVGIIGYGSVGRQIARLLQPFGVTVLASKQNAMQTEDHGYAPEGQGDAEGEFAQRIYPGKALRSMLQECDFVVVTVPLTEQTSGMIGEEQLAALKPNAYLIDVSRGGVIDHQALIAALEERKIAGATLDVFPEEPLPADSPLWEMPNVILTPHIAGFSAHYHERAAQLFGLNLRRYLEGKPLLNQFEFDRGY